MESISWASANDQNSSHIESENTIGVKGLCWQVVFYALQPMWRYISPYNQRNVVDAMMVLTLASDEIWSTVIYQSRYLVYQGRVPSSDDYQDQSLCGKLVYSVFQSYVSTFGLPSCSPDSSTVCQYAYLEPIDRTSLSRLFLFLQDKPSNASTIWDSQT